MVSVHEIRSEEQMATATSAGLSLEAGAGMLESCGILDELSKKSTTKIKGEVDIVHQQANYKKEYHYIIACTKEGNIQQCRMPDLSEEMDELADFEKFGKKHGSHFL